MKKKKDKQQDLPEFDHLSEEERVAGERAKLLFNTLRNEKFSAQDKQDLWDQVGGTLEQRKQKSFSTFWIAAAASVTLFILAGVGYLVFYKDPARAMQEVAARVPGADTGETRLILSDERAVSLRKKNSSVVYKEDGSLIQVDSSSTIDQQTAGDQQFNTLIVPYGKRSVLTLADGSRIWLNSGSKLVYPAHFDERRREVYLEGQAFFSVAHSETTPFLVHTRDMEVKVLGTEFDVSAYQDDDYTATVLATGSVELKTRGQSLFGAKTTRITPGIRAIVGSKQGGLTTQQVDVQEYISWKEGYLILKSAPLTEVLKKLSRYYRVDIELKQPKLAGVTFGGTLQLQEDIRLVLEGLSVVTGLHYEQKANERRYVFEESTMNP